MMKSIIQALQKISKLSKNVFKQEKIQVSILWDCKEKINQMQLPYEFAEPGLIFLTILNLSG